MNYGGRSLEVLENVSVDSLVKLAGVIDGANEIALEGHELRAMIAQVNTGLHAVQRTHSIHGFS